MIVDKTFVILPNVTMVCIYQKWSTNHKHLRWECTRVHFKDQIIDYLFSFLISENSNTQYIVV